MRNEENVCEFKKPSVTRLRLIHANGKHPGDCNAEPKHSAHSTSAEASVTDLANAMMNRLWIPPTSTIVGLLDVGLSRSNFEELSKWLVHQVDATTQQDTASLLPRLEKRFRATVDQFPEL